MSTSTERTRKLRNRKQAAGLTCIYSPDIWVSPRDAKKYRQLVSDFIQSDEVSAITQRADRKYQRHLKASA